MCDCGKCGCDCGQENKPTSTKAPVDKEEKNDDQKKDQGQEKYTDKEEEMIKAKLKDLGYLD